MGEGIKASIATLGQASLFSPLSPPFPLWSLLYWDLTLFGSLRLFSSLSTQLFTLPRKSLLWDWPSPPIRAPKTEEFPKEYHRRVRGMSKQTLITWEPNLLKLETGSLPDQAGGAGSHGLQLPETFLHLRNPCWNLRSGIQPCLLVKPDPSPSKLAMARNSSNEKQPPGARAVRSNHMKTNGSLLLGNTLPLYWPFLRSSSHLVLSVTQWYR